MKGGEKVIMERKEAKDYNFKKLNKKAPRNEHKTNTGRNEYIER